VMRVQTLFEPLHVRSLGGYSVVRTKDLKKLLERLKNAEMGFSYVHTHILPALKQSRDQHMLNAQKLKERLAAQGIEAQRAETPKSGSVRSTKARSRSDAPKGSPPPSERGSGD